MRSHRLMFFLPLFDESKLSIAFDIPGRNEVCLDSGVARDDISDIARAALTHAVNYLSEKSGLTPHDMADLNQLRKNKLYETEDLPLGLSYLKKLPLLKKEIQNILVATKSIFPFSKMFDGTNNSLNLRAPTSTHIKTMWEKIESDFLAAFHNDDHLNNNSIPVYFAHKNGSCSVTEKGKDMIKELGSYTIRHYILFTLWDFISTYRSDTKKPHREWDSVFPELFKSLVDSKELLEKKLLEPRKMQYVYFV